MYNSLLNTKNLLYYQGGGSEVIQYIKKLFCRVECLMFRHCSQAMFKIFS